GDPAPRARGTERRPDAALHANLLEPFVSHEPSQTTCSAARSLSPGRTPARDFTSASDSLSSSAPWASFFVLVSGQVHAAIAAIRHIPRVTRPMMSGTCSARSGGAIAVKVIGRNAAINSPMLKDTEKPETRTLVGKSSCTKLENVAFHAWKKMPTITMARTKVKTMFSFWTASK